MFLINSEDAKALQGKTFIEIFESKSDMQCLWLYENVARGTIYIIKVESYVVNKR